MTFVKEVRGETRSAGRILDICVAVGPSRHGRMLGRMASRQATGSFERWQLATVPSCAEQQPVTPMVPEQIQVFRVAC